MSIFKCKHCGADMEIESGMDVIECPSCSAFQIVPEPNIEKKISLYNLANRLRMMGEYDKSASIYEAVAAKFDEPEAYFGLCLNKYKVSYNGDEAICSITVDTPITEDENYISACSLATDSQLEVLTFDAEQIDLAQKTMKKAADEMPAYDIIVLVNDENRKVDSYVTAKEIYTILKAEGRKVCFPPISFKNYEGASLEAALYKAISTAKLLILFATNPARLNDERVMTPLTRYCNAMNLNPSNHKILPVLKNIPEDKIPECIKGIDIIDLADDSFIDHIMDGVDALFKVVITPEEKFITKARESFKAKDYVASMKYCDSVIKANKKNEEAYQIGLMASFEVDTIEDVLSSATEPIFTNPYYENAIINGVDALNSINDQICERIYQSCIGMPRDNESQITVFVNEISKLKGYKDVNDLIDKAFDPIYKPKYDEAMATYNKGIESKFERLLTEAYKQFKDIINYKDSKEMMSKIERDIESLNVDLCDESYQKGIALFKESKTMDDYRNAQNSFMKVMSYKDAKLWIFQCKERMYNLACEIIESSMSPEEVEKAMATMKFLHPYKETAYYYDKAQARIQMNDFNPKKRKIRV